jgi:hypothetical protein
MTAKFTNRTGLSLYAQVFLATDWYDHKEAGLSVTTLLKPLKQVILSKRVEPGLVIPDVEDYIASSVGTAVHDGFEKSWTANPRLKEVLISLGIPPGAANKLKVNPTPEEVAAGGIIPAYFELRLKKLVHGIPVSGKFDAVIDGVVEDLKNTSVFTYLSGKKDDDYILQGSMYRWLDPKKITKDYMNLTFQFTDWSKAMSYSNPNYPQKRMLTRRFNLLSLEQTEAYVNKRVGDLVRLMDAPEEMLPPCTDDDLWRTAPVWKYYKDPDKAYTPGSRSTKNFTTYHDAMVHLNAMSNVGVVVEVKGEVKACLYCAGFMACKQKDALIASGDLIVSSN